MFRLVTALLAYTVCLICSNVTTTREQILECDLCLAEVHRRCSRDSCSQDEYRRRRRTGQHIAFTCHRCARRDHHGAAAAALAEVEREVEEEGLGVQPAGPGAVPVDAALPEAGPAQVLEIGARALGPPAPPNPQPLPPAVRAEPRPFVVRLADPPPAAPLAPPPQLPPAAEDDRPITYTYLEEGSRKRGPLLVSSDGYTYGHVST